MKHVVILAALFFLCFTACSRDNDNIKRNQAQGNLIVAAIAEYTRDTSTEVQALTELVPTYLARIPTTVKGNNFFYTRSPIDGYTLCFQRESPQNGCCYLQQHDIWDCSLGDDA